MVQSIQYRDLKPAPDSQPALSVATRWYVLILLTAVYAVNIADRFMISTLIEPIKADLNLSDSAVAALTGTALAIFYVTAGLPLALLADRRNRRNLCARALLLPSLSDSSAILWRRALGPNRCALHCCR